MCSKLTCYSEFPDGFASFRSAFPEWCEDENTNANAKAALQGTTGPTEQLMGLR